MSRSTDDPRAAGAEEEPSLTVDVEVPYPFWSPPTRNGNDSRWVDLLAFRAEGALDTYCWD